VRGRPSTNRTRPGLDQALTTVREGDTLVVPKLDRLARSVPDARAIGDGLAARGIKLSLGGQVYDPTDPMGKMFFNILATAIPPDRKAPSVTVCLRTNIAKEPRASAAGPDLQPHRAAQPVGEPRLDLPRVFGRRGHRCR
jgi:hypothetical protein